MMSRRRTLTQFLIEERRRHPQATGELNALILDVALACKGISQLLRRGTLSGRAGYTEAVNPQGEKQHQLDQETQEIFVRVNEWGGRLAGMASEETQEVIPIPAELPKGKYLLLFDPLDGSAISDLNFSVGSIFSILRAPRPGEDAITRDFLQPGTEQVCAGYAIYGPSTMLVLTVGRGVFGFTLDPGVGEFLLTHPNLQIPATTSDFAINASNRRFWEPAVKLYVDECVAGKDGPRGRDFSMRWMGCLVAEAHRILLRGGVYLYPRDSRQPPQAGRLRLLYELNPIAFVIEQAAGLCSTGSHRLLELTPTDLHQRAGVIFGAREEVERLVRYHRDHNQKEYEAPLFGTRGLFKDPGPT
ncbi:MAG: class 1 fructose-bisphosphatase [Deltaproteobacteria bacterium]|nr:class 1 fructose-bisphosphatase [Deltaproteobacteria bacterium]